MKHHEKLALDALTAVRDVIESTYRHNKRGKRLEGESPVSGSDVVDRLLELEPAVFAAVKALEAQQAVDSVLTQLAETIEATGGVVRDRKGLYSPCGDEEWIDLGAVYVAACRALDRRAHIIEGD